MTAPPSARLDCEVRYRGHRHGSSCWTAKPPGTVHHASVWAEGRDWQCTCGSWGACQPGYMGYEDHIESILREMERSANDLLALFENGPWTNRQRGIVGAQVEEIRQRIASAF